MSKGKSFVVGIDPGTGSSSGAGVAVIQFANGPLKLIAAQSIWCELSKRGEAWERIKEIAMTLGVVLKPYEYQIQDLFIESFVMRGKGGETLARFTGAVIGALPAGVKFKEVANSKVKLLIGGRGDLDKVRLAEAVYDEFEHCPESIEIIERLVVEEDYDALDAIAIGLAGVKFHGAN